uniref:Uncharacterized protein n=1 Tax=Hemiselmis andersenii TaxID=464988 RepID=A0A6U2J5U3_HEMAN|mmetsp:Transcript_8628/g.20148  ORF Transcript_8628/g.20148 Transcript_8628/m.20148 type:complete len:182 (-) Transcript_8628:284-829(-)
MTPPKRKRAGTRRALIAAQRLNRTSSWASCTSQADPRAIKAFMLDSSRISYELCGTGRFMGTGCIGGLPPEGSLSLSDGLSSTTCRATDRSSCSPGKRAHLPGPAGVGNPPPPPWVGSMPFHAPVLPGPVVAARLDVDAPFRNNIIVDIALLPSGGWANFAGAAPFVGFVGAAPHQPRHSR